MGHEKCKLLSDLGLILVWVWFVIFKFSKGSLQAVYLHHFASQHSPERARRDVDSPYSQWIINDEAFLLNFIFSIRLTTSSEMLAWKSKTLSQDESFKTGYRDLILEYSKSASVLFNIIHERENQESARLLNLRGASGPVEEQLRILELQREDRSEQRPAVSFHRVSNFGG